MATPLSSFYNSNDTEVAELEQRCMTVVRDYLGGLTFTSSIASGGRRRPIALRTLIDGLVATATLPPSPFQQEIAVTSITSNDHYCTLNEVVLNREMSKIVWQRGGNESIRVLLFESYPTTTVGAIGITPDGNNQRRYFIDGKETKHLKKLALQEECHFKVLSLGSGDGSTDKNGGREGQLTVCLEQSTTLTKNHALSALLQNCYVPENGTTRQYIFDCHDSLKLQQLTKAVMFDVILIAHPNPNNANGYADYTLSIDTARIVYDLSVRTGSPIVVIFDVDVKETTKEEGNEVKFYHKGQHVALPRQVQGFLHLLRKSGISNENVQQCLERGQNCVYFGPVLLCNGNNPHLIDHPIFYNVNRTGWCRMRNRLLGGHRKEYVWIFYGGEQRSTTQVLNERYVGRV
jgi:hypothetical protein